jgi:probable F420-dependent oxidoreductase
MSSPAFLIDASLPPVPLTDIPRIAQAAEEFGFSALWSTETIHDPFLSGALVVEHTRHIGFGTAVAVSFARSPTTLAYTAWDLAQASQGRFILGIGTQVKAHIERRFGMSWPDSVVAKLREQIGVMHALWNTWQTQEPLNFRGDYYKVTLMSPFFNPGPISHPHIPIYIAGVNTGLARLAGEVAEGFLSHPLHSPRYLKEVILPAIEQGLAKGGRLREDFNLCTTAFVITSAQEEAFVRSQIAFYASTPSYRAVMDLHGWLETAEKLSSLAACGQWAEMPALIKDEMLAEFAVFGLGNDLPSVLRQRYHGLVDRLSLYLPFVPGERDAFWKDLVGRL